MQIKNALLVLCCSVLVISCGPRKNLNKEEEAPVLPRLNNFSTQSPRITIMTWNLENLFDTVDNPKTDDDAYLPLSVKKQIPGFEENCKTKGAFSWVKQCLEWDWTEEVLDLKLSRLAQVIASVDNGNGPDILVVQEVENLYVLEKMIQDHLQGFGYKAYLLENNDYRGIDVGLITRLKPIKKPELKDLRSRPALATQFNLGNGDKLNLIGVHFPISPTPVEKRLKMLETISQMTSVKEFTVAIGDFNFPKMLQDKIQLIPNYIEPKWIVGHQYCQGDCPGTFYDSYDGTWSQLDFILLSKNFLNPKTRWTLDPDSVRIHKPLKFQSTYDGLPADFNLPNLKGVSDHFPLVLQIVKTETINF